MWATEQQNALTRLIDNLCEKPVLTLYDLKAQHDIHTDATSHGLGGVLLQSTDGVWWQPVRYFSRHCTEAERKYPSYELEVLAVVETLQRFRVYVLGKHFRVTTDCAAIQQTKLKKELLPRISRWWMKLSEYDFEVVHRPGIRMSHVEALSRTPDEPPAEMETAGFVIRVTENDDDWLLTMQSRDEKLRHIIAVLNGVESSEQSHQFRQDYEIKNHRLYRRTEKGLRFLVSKAVRWRVVQHCHDKMGHFGLEKTISRVEENFWFPRVRNYVKSYLTACIERCSKLNGTKPEGRLYIDQEVEAIPFRQLHIDHLGPFIRSKRGNCYVLAISDASVNF